MRAKRGRILVPEHFPTTRWRHDLKNQLGIVLGYSELALEEMDKVHPLRADLEEILKAAHQAMALIEQLDQTD